MDKYDGRFHWGKQNFVDAKVLEKMYSKENVDNYRKLHQEMDPKGLFLNEYLKKRFYNSF